MEKETTEVKTRKVQKTRTPNRTVFVKLNLNRPVYEFLKSDAEAKGLDVETALEFELITRFQNAPKRP